MVHQHQKRSGHHPPGGSEFRRQFRQRRQQLFPHHRRHDRGHVQHVLLVRERTKRSPGAHQATVSGRVHQRPVPHQLQHVRRYQLRWKTGGRTTSSVAFNPTPSRLTSSPRSATRPSSAIRPLVLRSTIWPSIEQKIAPDFLNCYLSYLLQYDTDVQSIGSNYQSNFNGNPIETLRQPALRRQAPDSVVGRGGPGSRGRLYASGRASHPAGPPHQSISNLILLHNDYNNIQFRAKKKLNPQASVVLTKLKALIRSSALEEEKAQDPFVTVAVQLFSSMSLESLNAVYTSVEKDEDLRYANFRNLKLKDDDYLIVLISTETCLSRFCR